MIKDVIRIEIVKNVSDDRFVLYFVKHNGEIETLKAFTLEEVFHKLMGQIPDDRKDRIYSIDVKIKNNTV